MRDFEPQGRFTIAYERASILQGIDSEITKHVGQDLDWWRYAPTESESDDIYDVGSIAEGRHWDDPIVIPTVNIAWFQGVTVQSDRGFYNTDLLRVTMNMKDVEELLPALITDTDDFLKDRLVWKGQVYRPNKFYPRGQLIDDYTIFSFDALQINPEELVNDQQFATYAN